MKKLFFALAFFGLYLTGSWVFAREKEELLTDLDRSYYFCHVYGEAHTKTINVNCDGEILWDNKNSRGRGGRSWVRQWTELLGLMRERSGMIFKNCRIGFSGASLLVNQRERHFCDFVKP